MCKEWQCSRESYLSVTSPVSFSRGSSGNKSVEMMEHRNTSTEIGTREQLGGRQR